MTKSTFDVPVRLTRAALLRLLRDEPIEARNSPPGASMIEGVAKVVLHHEITEAERRALCDVLTRDVPDAYRAGYSVASWGEVALVAGSSEWLAAIASNADRIYIRAKRDGRFTNILFSEATQAEQEEAMRMWLHAGMTPEWEAYEPKPPVDDAVTWGTSYMGVPQPMKRYNIATERGVVSLATATGDDLDAAANALGLDRMIRMHVGGGATPEDDAGLRERCYKAVEKYERERDMEDDSFVKATPTVTPGKGSWATPAALGSLARTPTTSVAQEQMATLARMQWVLAQLKRIGAAMKLTPDEEEFLESIRRRLHHGRELTEKQARWFEDIAARVMIEYGKRSTLLPPLPR